MHPPANERQLRDALAAFETCLMTPLVSGESVPWVAHARETLDKVDALLRQHIAKNHRAQLANITREDKEMFAHADSIAKGDEHSLEQLDKLNDWGGRLATA